MDGIGSDGYLLPALTESRFSNQRDVVLNERRQNYENRPYGLAAMAIVAALFPPDHPYHWTTIGEIADLNAVRLDEVHDFFRCFYHPANASLAIAGDIEPEMALDLARACFGRFRPGPPGGCCRPSRAGRQRQAVSRRSRRAAEAVHGLVDDPHVRAGDAELDLVPTSWRTARPRVSIAGSCSRRRLPRTYRQPQNSREIAGFLQIASTAAPGHTLEEIERAVLEEIERLGAEGPRDEEMERGRVQAEAQFVFRLQTVGGFGGKSDQLNVYNVFVDDPGYFESDFARYKAATAG